MQIFARWHILYRFCFVGIITHLCIQHENPSVNYRFACSLQCRLHISILHCAYVSYSTLLAPYSRTTAIWVERAPPGTKAIWRNGALLQRIIQHKNIFCIDYRLSMVHVLTSLIFLLLFLACFKQIFLLLYSQTRYARIYNDAIKYRIIFIKTRRSIKIPCDAHNRWSNTSNASTPRIRPIKSGEASRGSARISIPRYSAVDLITD